MIDVAVQGLVHSEHEPSHTTSFLTRHIRAVLIALCNRLQARSTDFISQLVFGVRMNAPRSGCPINLTLEALGDRWSLIVIRDLMFGNRRHFRELLTRSEERIASNILADWLTRLEKAGLVSRRDDPSHKQKVIYSLTEASIALVPLLAHMGGWGLRHTPASKELSVRAKILEDEVSLRHGRRFTATNRAWTKLHDAWLRAGGPSEWH
jgi:DNA-binding HxlR family transcriptional regulator